MKELNHIYNKNIDRRIKMKKSFSLLSLILVILMIFIGAFSETYANCPTGTHEWNWVYINDNYHQALCVKSGCTANNSNLVYHSTSIAATCTSSAYCSDCRNYWGSYASHSYAYASTCPTCSYTYGSYACTVCGSTDGSRVHSSHTHSYVNGLCCCGATSDVTLPLVSVAAYLNSDTGARFSATASDDTGIVAYAWTTTSATPTTWTTITSATSTTLISDPYMTAGDKYIHVKDANNNTSYANGTVSILTYNANGGSNEPPVTYISGSVGVSASVPTKEEYMFEGWNTESDGSGTTYIAGQTVSTNLTLYAQWSTPHTITFNSNGGNGGSMNPQTFGSASQNLTLNGFTKTGYTFIGWATEPTGTVQYVNGESYIATASITLYAVWTETATDDTAIIWQWDTNWNLTKSFTMKNTASVTIDWGDGNTETVTDIPAQNVTKTHTYASEGRYTVQISENAISVLDISGQKVTMIDASGNTSLVDFNFSNNLLSSVDISTSTALEKINSLNTGILTLNSQTSYDVSRYTNLDTLSYDRNSSSNLVLGSVGDRLTTINSSIIGNIYTVTFNANTGSNTMEPQLMSGEARLNANLFNKSGSTFNGWNTSADGTGTAYADGATITLTANMTLYAQWRLPENAPVLDTGMTAVNWNGTDWVSVTNLSDWDYNYNTASAWNETIAGDGTAKWANAMIDADNDGTLDSLYVWIPRFTYYTVAGTNKVSVNSDVGDANGTGDSRTYILWSNGTTDYTTDPSGATAYTYSAHEAFTSFGSTGFWVMKYEASRNNASDSEIGTGTIPFSKPNVKSWVSTKVSDMYDVSKSLNTALDSHLIKDTEWGAVAMLTSAIGRIPYINNNGNRITGYAGDTQNASSSANKYLWNDASAMGVRGSTTHNVYGIFDMSGGVGEYTASYYTGYDISTTLSYIVSLTENKDTKYVNKYTTSEVAGDNARLGWDSDSKGTFTTDSPASERGLYHEYTNTAGIFTFTKLTGASSNHYGFRVVLCPISSSYTITFDANTGTGSMTNQTITGNDQINANTFTKAGYYFEEWNTSADGSGTSYADGATITPTANMTLYAQWKSPVNKPVLGGGMTAVNWNGTDWVPVTNLSDWNYNYNTASAWNATIAGDGTAKWANAMIDADNDGTLDSLYVWIPRFTYHTVEGTNKVSVNSDIGDANETGDSRTYILWSNGTTDYTTDPSEATAYTYTAHEAFTSFGSTGFWVMKYEASRNDASASDAGVGTKIISKPGVVSYRNVEVTDLYTKGKNLNPSLDSHLIKDTEWGAVALLTSAVGRIPYKNNNDSYITGYTGETQDESSSGTKYLWNDSSGKGVRGSTTHNVYGVFDMSGGVSEYTAAYYASSTYQYITNLRTNGDTKYVNKYTDTLPSGDCATLEWDSDLASEAFEVSYPARTRGYGYDKTVEAGIFGAGRDSGAGKTAVGFRAVLCPIEHTLSFDSNGGMGAMSPQVMAAGTIRINTFTKTGYTFEGWNTVADGSGMSYADGATIVMAEDVTLYAQWTQNTYTITFDKNGGTGTMANQTLVSGQINANTFTKDNYGFNGWNTSADGSGTSYADGATITLTDNITLYAQWTNNSLQISATATGNGTISPNGVTTVSSGGSQAYTITPNTGYRILDVLVDGVSIGAVSTHTFNNVSENHTIEAIFADYAIVLQYVITSESPIGYLELKTNGTTTIDWGDGTIVNVPNSSDKFELYHVYSSAGTYTVKIRDDVTTYLDCSDGGISSMSVNNTSSLTKVFAYNNDFTSLVLTDVTNMTNLVVDSNVTVTGSATSILKVGVSGPARYEVSDDVRVSFISSAINTLTGMTLDGSAIAVSNPYNASELTGTHVLIATYTAGSIGETTPVASWTWNMTEDKSRTVVVEANNDTILLWGDGTYDNVLAGSISTYTHTYTNGGAKTAGFADGTIKSLSIIGGNVTEVNISAVTSLEKLNLNSNSLHGISLTSNTALKELNVSNNELTDLILTHNTGLTKLECAYNSINALGILSCTGLKYLDCSGNGISLFNSETEFNMSSYSGLETLICDNNGINTINLGNISGLKKLSCADNNLETISVGLNTALTELNCARNGISTLSLSSNTALKILDCSGNQLSTLNIIPNTAIEEIRTYNNGITALNLSATEFELAIIDYGTTPTTASGTHNILKIKTTGNGHVTAYGYIDLYASPDAGYVLSSILYDSNIQAISDYFSLTDYSGTHDVEFIFGAEDPNAVSVAVNRPNLLNGMIPVRHDGENWVATLTGDSRWYNYNSTSKIWANVMLRDGATYDNSGTQTSVGELTLTALNGKTVTGGSMLVWIPRFSYKIDGEGIYIKFSQGISDDTTDNYMAHPAFNMASYKGGDTSFNSNYEPILDYEGKLNGFWAAKYPASNNAGIVASKPGATDWTSISIGNATVNTTDSAYDVSKAIVGTNMSSYGLSAGDAEIYNSHLMKNVEWGAIAYLTKAFGDDSTLATSTTNNAYGIYGMTSGSEFVASYVELVGGISNYSVRTNGSSMITYLSDSPVDTIKFVDILRLTSPTDNATNNFARLENYYGTATYETSTAGTGSTSFNSAASVVPNGTNAFFIRGGDGLFAYSGSDGSASASIGFRPVILARANQALTSYYNITATANAGGRISPSGTITFESGSNQTYVITADDGYVINDVLVDNVSVGTGSSYTFSNITGNHTIEVVFASSSTTITITFDANGGSGTVNAQTGIQGNTVTLNANAFSYPGYTFTGWNTEADGSGTEYAAGGSVTLTANLNLYAQWLQE